MKHYDNIVSLGYFCSVALELERLGLRNISSPFDWCISNFEGVISAIANNFDGFLDDECLYQSSCNHNYYFNSKYKIWFYHDFDQYHTLKKQLGPVVAKYTRRIDRFYQNISKPTLFIRYISDEVLNETGKSVELDYIENNYKIISSLLKSFNEDNEIIFLANNGVNSQIIQIFNVKKDDNDKVARMPFEKNKDLKNLLMSIEYAYRSSNLDVYIKKQKRANRGITRLTHSLEGCIHRLFFPIYSHEKQI